MRIFDSDGAPYSYEHLGRLAPEPPPEWQANGRLRVEIPVKDFPTTARDEDELLADLVMAYNLQDADVLDFDMEDA